MDLPWAILSHPILEIQQAHWNCEVETATITMNPLVSFGPPWKPWPMNESCDHGLALHALQAPLPLTAIKSRMGYATECAGIASLHRLILSGMCGVLAPNNHLQQLNPHLSFDNKAALLTVTRLQPEYDEYGSGH